MRCVLHIKIVGRIWKSSLSDFPEIYIWERCQIMCHLFTKIHWKTFSNTSPHKWLQSLHNRLLLVEKTDWRRLSIVCIDICPILYLLKMKNSIKGKFFLSFVNLSIAVIQYSWSFRLTFAKKVLIYFLNCYHLNSCFILLIH